MAAPVLCGNGLSTDAFADDVRLATCTQILEFEDSIALLQQIIKDLIDEKRIERLQSEFGRLQEKLANMQSGSVSKPRSGCSEMDNDNLCSSQSFGPIAGHKEVNLDTLSEISQPALPAAERLRYQGLGDRVERRGWRMAIRKGTGTCKKSGLDIVKIDCIVRYPQISTHI